MLIILNFISNIWLDMSNRYNPMFHTLCNGNHTVCMHLDNLIRVTFMLGVLSSNTPFYAENIVPYFVLVRDMFSIFSFVVACNLLALVFSHQLPVDYLFHVEQHVPTKHNL